MKMTIFIFFLNETRYVTLENLQSNKLRPKRANKDVD